MNYKVIIKRGKEAKMVCEDSILKVTFERKPNTDFAKEPTPEEAKFFQIMYNKKLSKNLNAAYLFSEEGGSRYFDKSGNGNDKPRESGNITVEFSRRCIGNLLNFWVNRHLDQFRIPHIIWRKVLLDLI
jgi:hypothetical protein